MNKKYILIIVSVFLLLLLLAGCGIGGYFIYKNYVEEKEDTRQDEGTDTESDEIVVEKSGQMRVEGDLIIYGLGDPDSAQVVIMSKDDLSTNYMQLTSEDEKLDIYVTTEEGTLYTYISDGNDTIRFPVDEGTSEEFYDSIVDMDPTDEVSEIDTYDENADFEVSYEGEEECQDMECDKYKIIDKENDGEMIVWIDKLENLPRKMDYKSEYVDGVFDFYYNGVEFDVPSEYDEINANSPSGWARIYSVGSGFIDLFL
jgi:hypothetical protein